MESRRPASSGKRARMTAMKLFMSAVPRPNSLPSAARSANGSLCQSWPSTGTTSVWPDSMMPPMPGGPIVA